MFSPDQAAPSQEKKQRRRSISISLHETSTPSVKSLLSSSDSAETSSQNLSFQHDNADLQSAYDKLTIWKRTIEKQLNRTYLQKLKEIDRLVIKGFDRIDVVFHDLPSFDQLASVIGQQPFIDHAYDNIQFDYEKSVSFDLTSNNILLCASDHYALVYDHMKSKLILYNSQGYVKSFLWDTNEYGEPCDLTYSFYLDLFCIITNRGLLTWSIESSAIPTRIHCVKPIGPNRLWSLASTETRSDVFILYKLGSYIERWNSMLDNAQWQQIQRWSNHDLFERNDQRIRTIRMTSNYVAWTVETTSTSEWRVDLLDYHLQVIRTGIKINHLDRASSCLLSNFGPEQFLIIDSNRHQLFLMDSQGNIRLKTDYLTMKRIKNAVLMKGAEQSWLVVRLEQPNQLYFIALANFNGSM